MATEPSPEVNLLDARIIGIPAVAVCEMRYSREKKPETKTFFTPLVPPTNNGQAGGTL